jgi:sigma-B regulation protein RsbU (phosphoserine phosphatase)
LGLFLLFAIAVTTGVRNTSEIIGRLLYGKSRAGSPIDLADVGYSIVGVGPEASAAGIQKGDSLIKIDRKPFKGLSDMYVPLRRARAGDRMMFQVSRETSSGIEVMDAAVTLGPREPKPVTLRDWIQSLVVSISIPIVCLLVGFFVVAVRPSDPLAWIVLFVLLGFGQQVEGDPFALYGNGDRFQPIVIVFHQSLGNGWPIAMMLFGIYFPVRLASDRRWPWAKWLLLVPLGLHLLANTVMRLLESRNIALAMPINSVLEPLDRPLFALGLVGVGFFFFGTSAKLHMTTNPDARRRLSLLLWGSALSLSPVFALIVKNFLLREARFEMASQWLIVAVLLPLFFFPVILAHLIVVQRALDVRVMVRQSVQYILARNTVRVLQIGLIVVVIFVASFLATDPANMKNHPQRIQIIAEGILGVFLVQRVAEKLRRWIDRRFFREAYDAELVLSDLAEKVRTIVETQPLLEIVARRISESLHVTKIALLLPESSGAFQPAYALGYPAPLMAHIPPNAATTLELQREQRLEVYADDQQSWIYKTNITEQERRALQNLQSEVLLPLSLNRKLLGILSLGPKQSEAPFSKADLRLLDSVATQTGLALENSRLTAEVANEVAQRERINRELEIAREVQERLFPQELPRYPGLDYAGSCRPALGVGGDYYDFIRLSDKELGIAIGDVSGKGIAAALLMSSLRASLRGQIIHHETDLAVLMGNVNTLIYEGSTSNRYATFFYAQYDAVSRRLTYVNAGHNPPLIFRKGCGVIRLDVGGPVVGLLSAFPYQQAVLELESGDLFVSFTDGISEAMNAADQEWGEDRLIDQAWKSAGLSAAETMREIIAAVDKFVAGAKQHDDMTIITARIR